MISDNPQAKRSPRIYWMLLLAAFAVAFAVYANTFLNGMTYDDGPVIVQNPDIQSLGNFFVNQNPGRPLRELSLMLDRAIFGMQPAGWHIQHLFWHGLNGFLVGALLLRLGGGTFAALTAVALFLVHPLQVEVVAQLSHRKDNLALAMALLSLHVWLFAPAMASLRRRTGCWILAVVLFLLGCLAKESVVVLPLVAVAWELLFLPPERRVLARFPRMLLLPAGAALLSGLIWYLFFGGRDYLLTIAGYQLFKYNHFTPVTEWSYLPILLKSWLFMSGRILWPFDLALEYVYPLPQGWLDPWVLGALMMLAAWGWGVVFAWRRQPLVAFALLWVALLWLPVANLWPTSAYFAADRYLYAPLAGVAILAGCAADFGLRRWRQPTAVVAVVLLGGLCLLTWRQNTIWKDHFVLWRQAWQVSPQSPVTLNNYGVQLIKKGEVAEGMRLIEQAAQNPYYYEANANAAAMYQRMGQAEKAGYYRQRASDPHAGNKFRFH